jgi:hypothetical protein
VSGSVPLISDEVTITLVELYAARRGINRNEALRRLVRTGLGVDPVGFWQDRRRGAKAPRDMIAAVRKLRPKRAPKHIPPEHLDMFLDLKKKLGASEARRLVAEHARLRGGQ